jgi:adenylate cyclase, class 2
MGIEIELKLRVESHEPIRRRLQELGATLRKKVVETNRILDRPNGELRRRGCGLRVRTVVDVQGRPRPAKLTFKGPRQPGDLKSREEVESIVEDPAAVVSLLEGLGFGTSLCYEKRRESWLWRDCIVELDEPAALGLFVEIEGPSSEAIRAVQVDLKLSDAESMDVSYVGMLAAYCEASGIRDRTLHF